MNFKGFSPLVAVVMLVGFTLLVTGILGSYLTQFAQEQRSLAQYCTGARIIILSGIYQDSPTQGLSDVTLSIHNFGDVELTLNVLETLATGVVMKASETATVGAGEVAQLKLEGLEIANVTEFTVQSQTCAGAQDFIKVSDMKKV